MLVISKGFTDNTVFSFGEDKNMLTFITGLTIIVLFGLRPFAYKPASRELKPEVSSYFTAVWCLLFAIPTIPFCWHYFLIDGVPVIFTKGIIFPLIKGVSLYCFMRLNQIVNRENTSSSVFWGVISLAIATLVTTFVFAVPLPELKFIIIIFIGVMGFLFFTFGEGKALSAAGKKAFAGILFFSALNTVCDTMSIQYANWYVLYTVPAVGMLLCSMIFARKGIRLKDFFTTKHIVIAGAVYALGELILIFSMQSFFPVIAAIFLIRVAQSIDLVLAYHLHKEGSAGVQYFFALGMIILSYFFFFGI